MSSQMFRQLATRLSSRPGGRPSGGNGGFLAGPGLILLGLGGYGLANCLFNVEGGHRVIKYSRISGVKNDIYSEGTHFRLPWFEIPIDYDIRAKPRSIPSLTGTKDLQMVNITCRVLSRPKIDKIPEIHRTIGPDYDEKVLPSIVNEVLKSIVAQFNASQLITQRDKVSKLVRENLTLRASRFNIILDDVSITHVAFSPEFTHAVEAKQVAQQEAQRAAFVVEKAIQDKQSNIVKAQGEAEAAKLIGDAITNKPGFVELRTIETARDIASTLSKSSNRIILNSNSLLLNLNEQNAPSKK